MEEILPVLYWNEKTDLVAIETECPICGDRYMHGVPYANVPCNKCGQTYKTKIARSIYDRNARRVTATLAYSNGVVIVASEKFEADLTNCKHHYENQLCWDMSFTRGSEVFKYCINCGVCLNCFTCSKCGKQFTRDKNKRKQRCPECESSEFTVTKFREPIQSKENKHKKVCPHCKSDNIKLTLVKNTDTCPVCQSKKFTDEKINILFMLTIKRKVGYRRTMQDIKYESPEKGALNG